MSTLNSKYIIAIPLILTIFACSSLTPKPAPSAAAIEKEEQAIYSFFMPVSGTALILQNTSSSISDDDPQETVGYIKSGLESASRETLDSFLERNQQPSQLAPDMDLGADYVLLSADELAEISSQPNWGEALKERYPGSEGYIMFSRVGFNKDLNQAVIYVGGMLGPLMGSGSYYLMEKQNGEWLLKDQLMSWVS